MSSNRRTAVRKQRGIALVVVLSMVVLIALAVTFAISVSGKDTRDNAKQVHNLTVQNVTEGTMQQARALFSKNQLLWNTYLQVTYPTSASDTSGMAALKSSRPELVPTVPAGFTCFMYARDDADEIPPAVNNPFIDNNQTIYIGAVCSGPASSSELTGVLTFDNTRFKYTAASPAAL